MGTRRQTAKALQISRQRLERLLKEGRIVETAAGIDIAAARRAYADSVDPAKRAAYLSRVGAPADAAPGSAPRETPTTDAGPAIAQSTASPAAETGQVLSYADARTQKEIAHANRAQLEYRIKAGHFLARDEVAAKEFAIARKMRDRILGFPARLASYVPPDAMKIITDECDALIRELQDEAATIGEATTGT